MVRTNDKPADSVFGPVRELPGPGHLAHLGQR